MRTRLRGFLGWLFWSIIHIYFLIGTRHRLMVAFEWLWDYLTFQRGARLITDYMPPPPDHPTDYRRFTNFPYGRHDNN